MKLLLVCLALVLAAGCTAQYNVRPTGGTAAHASLLDRTRPVFISVPRDGAYESRGYAGSGQTVAHAVGAAFSQRAARVQVAAGHQETDRALQAAKSAGAGYLVVPVISHWEQRATEWSGLPSRMTVLLSIVDVASGQQVTSSSVEGRSRVISWTRTSPESLLKDPLAQYVEGIYK